MSEQPKDDKHWEQYRKPKNIMENQKAYQRAEKRVEAKIGFLLIWQST